MSNNVSPETLGRVLRWGIFGFLAYVLLHNGLHLFNTVPASPQQHPAGLPDKKQETAHDKNCDDTNPLKNFSLLALPFVPEITSAVRTEDTATGTGSPAQCGQQASLRYEYVTHNGAVLFSNMEKSHAPTDIRLGDGRLLPGVEANVLGMKVDGARKMIVPPALAFGGLKDLEGLADHAAFTIPKGLALGRESILARVSLLSLSPEAPVSAEPMRFVNLAFGSGAALECGDEVHAHLSIWKLDGTPVYTTTESGPVTFTLGASQMPYGIEQAALNMRVGSQRTIILPPAFAKPLNPTGATVSVLPANILPPETVLVEMSLVNAVEKAPPVAPSASPAPVK